MSKHIPFDKLSKKAKKTLAKKRRATWGTLNPTTRRPPNPKVYNRKKTRSREDDNLSSSLFFISEALYAAICINKL
ncbi:MAG: hypothetical protein CVU97_02615 [Firmicutes bacterium HGW-Firmicutes-21]|nr:MAG: hypothetical protein CVU97_02615 [Firmicutes bacterium HGW-Firmicutes-21]